ncbi:hypothetical protein [Plantactinospora veratri]
MGEPDRRHRNQPFRDQTADRALPVDTPGPGPAEFGPPSVDPQPRNLGPQSRFG